MKIALLARDSDLARQLAQRVAERWDLRIIVSESGRAARRRKLRRELRRGFPWRVPSTLLDLAALWLLESRWTRYRRGVAGETRPWPSGPEIVEVHDANDMDSVRALRGAEVDVVLVLGTAILGEEILRALPRPVLNVHGGIVPQYRNVHSEFWAVMRDDLANVGVSVLHLDAGIDSGAVALQRRLDVDAGEPFFSVRRRNGQLAIETALDALALVEAGELPAVAQRAEEAGFYRTPGARAILRFLVKTRRGVRAPEG